MPTIKETKQETVTEPKTEPRVEPITEPKTEPSTKPRTDFSYADIRSGKVETFISAPPFEDIRRSRDVMFGARTDPSRPISERLQLVLQGNQPIDDYLPSGYGMIADAQEDPLGPTAPCCEPPFATTGEPSFPVARKKASADWSER